MLISNKNITHLLSAVLICIAFPCFGFGQAQTENWLDFERSIETAAKKDTPILVNIWAPWCGWCLKMKNEVFPELPDLLLQKYTLTELNRENHTKKIRYKGRNYTPYTLAKHFQAESVPTLVILSSEGEYQFHISGYLSANKLRYILDKILVSI